MAERGGSLSRSPFARKVGGLVLYTALGQSVFLVTAPLLGRIFSPAEFGFYGLFLSFVSTAALVIAMNYDFAIPAARDDDDARRLTALACLIAAIVAPLVGLTISILCSLGVVGFEGLPAWSGLLATLLLFLIIGVQLLQNWMIRWERVIRIGQASLTMNLVRGIVQVGMGFFMPRWFSLVSGEILGRVGNAVHLWRRPATVPRGSTKITRADLRGVAHRYRQFPLVLLPAQVVDGISVFVQNAALAALFGPVALGQYYLMRRALDLPVAFVSRSLSDIFYARFSTDARAAPHAVRPFLIRAVLILAALGSVVAIPIAVAAPWGFGLLFGPAWREAGVLASIMTPAFVVNLAVAPAARVFALTARAHLRLVFTVFYFTTSVLVVGYVAVRHAGLREAVIGLSIGSVVSYTAYFISAVIASSHLRVPSAETKEAENAQS